MCYVVQQVGQCSFEHTMQSHHLTWSQVDLSTVPRESQRSSHIAIIRFIPAAESLGEFICVLFSGRSFFVHARSSSRIFLAMRLASFFVTTSAHHLNRRSTA